MSSFEPGDGGGRAASPRSFLERVLGVIRLDAAVFDEVEHDPSAMGQAALVIALAALAQGVGGITSGGVAALIGGLMAGFLGWFLGAGIVWLVGVKVYEHTSDYGELLRTIGFASAPQLLLVLGVLPLGPLRALLHLGVAVLLVVVYVVAVRQALDVSTGRAIWVCGVAVLINFLLAALLMRSGLLPMPATG